MLDRNTPDSAGIPCVTRAHGNLSLTLIFTFAATGFLTGNAADKVGLRSAAGRTVHMSREERMSRFAIRVATLTVLSVGIIATAPTIPVFAAGGGGGGGGGGPLD